MACQVSAMTLSPRHRAHRLHRRARCAGGSMDVKHFAPVVVGAQAQRVSWTHRETIKRRRVAILKWVAWRVHVGPTTVLVGAPCPVNPGACVGFAGFAMTSRGHRAHHSLDAGLAPREFTQCQVGGPPSEYIKGFHIETSKKNRFLQSSTPGPTPSGPHRSVPSSVHWLRSCPLVLLRDGAAPGFVSPPSAPYRRQTCRTPSSCPSQAREEDGCFSAGYTP